MLLRASSELRGDDVDLHAITDPKAAAASGIANAEALVTFADALVSEDEAALDRAREVVLDELGAVGLVDTAAVASNFERMVRIADGCGIALDLPMLELTSQLREDLGIDGFGSSSNTPAPGLVGVLVGPLIRVAAPRLIRLVNSLRNR